MATVFDDQIALAELMGNSFAPIRRLGQARVALAERDLKRAEAEQDMANEFARRERAAAVAANRALQTQLLRDEIESKRQLARDDQTFARQTALEQMRQEYLDNRTKEIQDSIAKRAVEDDERAIKKAAVDRRAKLLDTAMQYGVTDIKPETPDAEIFQKMQERATKSAQPYLQRRAAVSNELNALSTVPQEERERYNAALIMSDPEVDIILRKYPDIAQKLATAPKTGPDAYGVQQALAELMRTRDSQEARRAFAMAAPKATAATMDYVAAREADSRNFPRVKALTEELSSIDKYLGTVSKAVLDPDFTSQLVPQGSAQPQAAQPTTQNRGNGMLGLDELMGASAVPPSAAATPAPSRVGFMDAAAELGSNILNPAGIPEAIRRTGNAVGGAVRGAGDRVLPALQSTGRFIQDLAGGRYNVDTQVMRDRFGFAPPPIQWRPDPAPMITTPNPLGEDWQRVYDEVFMATNDPMQASRIANQQVYGR